ncbi:putative nucleotidyltransferase substrate binding domain-containing protein [Geoalkalibacter sp.]|uniref:putative nucleotidyltransferase substrate binding domain-containing protein n=1 Tax=Geoalkalibacter sp. TaxID=3041440 RepID=UPI00272DED8A|nr:putative nucleotidyltransferase substrate binding domain-containing protein [Geoalkalibacter sp.]
MSNPVLGEDGFFFLQVDALCKSPAVTCTPETSIVEAARTMRDQQISGLVVVKGEIPAGIVSARDICDLIAVSGGTVDNFRVADVMKGDLVTIARNQYVYDAIFKMAKYNIHRVVVVDEQGRLHGVVTDTDFLSLQTRSPLYLTREIEFARSIKQLRAINEQITETISRASRSIADTPSLVQLISHFNDAFTLRVIALMESDEGIVLPAGAAYLALGSEGRGEQTLRTDQDSAMIYADDLGESALRSLERFAQRLVDALEEVGVPRCPGNTLASNPEWRCSLSTWKERLSLWISVPKPEHLVNFSMFQDFRTLHGDASLESRLHEHVQSCIQRNTLYLPYMARHVEGFRARIGMFGRILVERRGEGRGKVDIKKNGIFALTQGVSLLALELGIHSGTTWDKIDQLHKHGILSADDVETLDESFSYLMRLRISMQLHALAAGTTPTNYIDPLLMSTKERERLRSALKGVNSLMKILRVRYKLDSIAR